MNDGPLCRCSLKSRKSGIRHDIYPGEGVIKTHLILPCFGIQKKIKLIESGFFVNLARVYSFKHRLFSLQKIPLCDPQSNNVGKLYHYRIAMSPSVNFLVRQSILAKKNSCYVCYHYLHTVSVDT